MGSGTILLLILPIGYALASLSNGTETTNEHLVNLQLKENLSNFIMEMRDTLYNGTSDSLVKGFSSRLKTFGEGEGSRLMEEKPYYKKKYEAAQTLLQYVQYTRLSQYEFHRYIKEEDVLDYLKDFLAEITKIAEEMTTLPDDEAATKIKSLMETAFLLEGTINDDEKPEEVKKVSNEIEELYLKIVEHYKNNPRIHNILTTDNLEYSENIFKGRELTDEEYVQFNKDRGMLELQVFDDIGGVYVIYAEGKCKVFSYADDEFRTSYDCHFDQRSA